MSDVSLRVVGARVAVATVLQRRQVGGEFGARQVDSAVFGVKRTGAADAGGGDSVERIGAGFNRGEEIVRFGDAQQVAGFVFGQFFGTPAHNGSQVFLLERSA